MYQSIAARYLIIADEFYIQGVDMETQIVVDRRLLSESKPFRVEIKTECGCTHVFGMEDRIMVNEQGLD